MPDPRAVRSKIEPTCTPLEFTEHQVTTPPSKSARKIAPTTPPSNLRNFISTIPPGKSNPPFQNPGYGPADDSRTLGHVVRMSPNRIPNIMLYGRVHGKRPVGMPKKRWLDNVREDCKILGLTVEDADQLARDRARWRSGVTRLLERADLSVSQEQ